MKIFVLTIVFVFGFVQNQCDKKANVNQSLANKAASNQTPRTVAFDRLPDGIEPDTKVRKATKNAKGEIVSSEIVTVGQRLKELGAKFEGDKLVDEKGREIRFYEPFCRGASQGFEEDRKARKEKERELAELEENYTVIVLYCDPKQSV